jgi:uncharacterized protein
MQSASLAPRLERLPIARVGDLELRVAAGVRARLLGLAWLDLEQVGDGLLIPRCASVHTFGMRFPLELVFLGPGGVEAPPMVRAAVAPGRVAWHRRASAVIELPAGSSQRAGISGRRGGRGGRSDG